MFNIFGHPIQGRDVWDPRERDPTDNDMEGELFTMFNISSKKKQENHFFRYSIVLTTLSTSLLLL